MKLNFNNVYRATLIALRSRNKDSGLARRLDSETSGRRLRRAQAVLACLYHVALLAMLDAWLARANIDLGRLLGPGRLANRQECLADSFEH